MHQEMLLVLSMLVPFAWLVLLLGLAWLEDTLNDDVRKTERRYRPEPIRAVPLAVRQASAPASDGTQPAA
jgi:hypothetical protein